MQHIDLETILLLGFVAAAVVGLLFYMGRVATKAQADVVAEMERGDNASKKETAPAENFPEVGGTPTAADPTAADPTGEDAVETGVVETPPPAPKKPRKPRAPRKPKTPQ